MAELEQALRTQLHAQLGVTGSEPLTDAQIVTLAGTQRTQARQHMAGLVQHPDLLELIRHHMAVTEKKDPSKQPRVELASVGDDILEVNIVNERPDHLSISAGSAPRRVGMGDLVRLGIHTEAGWNALMRRSVVATAGLGGDATDPSILAQARRALQSEIAEYQTIEHWISGNRPPPRILLLEKLMRLHKTERLWFARLGTEKLSLYLNSSSDVVPKLQAHDPLVSTKIRWATLSDFARFGLDNLAAIDAAAGELLMGYSTELPTE